MKRVISLAAGIAALLVISTPAFAQQSRKAAVTMTSGSSIGLLLHVSDSVAVRPDFSFTRNTTESTIGSTTTNSSAWVLGADASALFYVAKIDGVRTYLSPRFGVSHAKSTSSPSTTTSSPTNAYNLTGSFGAQYGLGDRFMAFGEFGLGYAWQNSSSGVGTTKAHSIGTRTAVGVGFYF